MWNVNRYNKSCKMSRFRSIKMSRDFKPTLSFILAIFVLTETFRLCVGDCTLLETADDNENELLKRIEPLKGSEFEVIDTDGNQTYTYKLKICDEMKTDKEEFVGALQVDKDKNSKVLGRINKVDIASGKDFILLTYFNGSNYGSHCNGTSRIAMVMIVCDSDSFKGEIRILDEKKKKQFPFCYYLFEIGSNIACTPKPDHLSSGSIFCILFFTFASVYLLFGFLYNRFVVGAKGLEQIPNYSFWKAFGNLQADACDFVCRCGARHESTAYRGIDERLKEAERDDQMLNM